MYADFAYSWELHLIILGTTSTFNFMDQAIKFCTGRNDCLSSSTCNMVLGFSQPTMLMNQLLLSVKVKDLNTNTRV